MAQSPMRYGSAEWDRFDMHRLGLAVTRAGGDLFKVLPELREVQDARRGSERSYVRALARHTQLRRAILRLGRTQSSVSDET